VYRLSSVYKVPQRYEKYFYRKIFFQNPDIQPGNSTIQHLNISTSQQFNISTIQHLNNSTFQQFNNSTSQHFNISTFQHLNISTSQHLNISTSQHLNISTIQQFNNSTFQHFNISKSPLSNPLHSSAVSHPLLLLSYSSTNTLLSRNFESNS